jgi:hypothetical protein
MRCTYTSKTARVVRRTGGSHAPALIKINVNVGTGKEALVRRSKRSIDLRNLPLDGFDMFLLAQLDMPQPLGDLIDIAPCDSQEAMRRVRQLAALGVVEISGDLPPELRVLAPAKGAATLADADDDDDQDSDQRMTLRPPPAPRVEPRVEARAVAPKPQQQLKRTTETRSVRPFSRTLSEDDATTLRPPAPLAVSEMMRAAEEATMRSVVDRSSGVVEKQNVNIEFKTPREIVAADGRVVRDRSVFSRQTLVDEDVQERAREAEDPRAARRR